MQQENLEETNEPKYIEKLLNPGKRIFQASNENDLQSKLLNFSLPMSFDKINKDNAERIYEKHSVLKTNAKPLKETRSMKRLKKFEKEKTLGQKWEGMKAKELTPELKNELRILKLRNYISPSEFFKKSEFGKYPKYFQIGTFVGGPDDYRPTRLVKRERKNNLVEQFLQEDLKENFSKKKFMEIQSSKSKIFKTNKLKKLKKYGKKIIKRR